MKSFEPSVLTRVRQAGSLPRIGNLPRSGFAERLGVKNRALSHATVLTILCGAG